MNLRKTFRATVAALGATMLALGVVWVASAAPPAAPSNGRPATTAKRQQPVTISAFAKKFRPTRAQRLQRRSIERQLKRSPRASIAAGANGSRSRAVPVSGYPASVWIVPAEDGAVCTFIPDPVDGWGAGCATAEEVADGVAVTMLGGGSTGPLTDSLIVAVVVPDGAEGPTVRRPDGTVEALDVSLNVAAAVVPPGALVRSGRTEVTVPDPRPSECSPRAGGGGSEAGTYLQCAP